MTIKTQTESLKNIISGKKKLTRNDLQDLTRFLLIQGRKSEKLRNELSRVVNDENCISVEIILALHTAIKNHNADDETKEQAIGSLFKSDYNHHLTGDENKVDKTVLITEIKTILNDQKIIDTNEDIKKEEAQQKARVDNNQNATKAGAAAARKAREVAKSARNAIVVAKARPGPQTIVDNQTTKQEAEEKARQEAARRKAEKEAARRRAEEARRKAEEEEAKRKAEKEEARRKAEEARRKAEKEAARRKAEEARRKAEEEEAKRKAEKEEARRKADEAKRKAEKEEAEEKAKQKAAKEAARKEAAEEKAKREAKAREEAARRQKEAEASNPFEIFTNNPIVSFFSELLSPSSEQKKEQVKPPLLPKSSRQEKDIPPHPHINVRSLSQVLEERKTAKEQNPAEKRFTDQREAEINAANNPMTFIKKGLKGLYNGIIYLFSSEKEEERKPSNSPAAKCTRNPENNPGNLQGKNTLMNKAVGRHAQKHRRAQHGVAGRGTVRQYQQRR